MDQACRLVLEKLSELLASCWRDAKNPAQIAREIIPLNLEEAYFVRDRMHQLLNENISGWKVGATNPEMREIDGHEDIIPGRIFCCRTYMGAYQSMDISLFPNARAEAEFGFRLLEKPEGRRQPWTAREISSIMVLHPAVELIGNRFWADMVGSSVNAALANYSKALAGQGFLDDVNVTWISPGQTETSRLQNSPEGLKMKVRPLMQCAKRGYKMKGFEVQEDRKMSLNWFVFYAEISLGIFTVQALLLMVVQPKGIFNGYGLKRRTAAPN